MALDFITKATIFQNSEFKNRVAFAVREAAKNALNYYNASPANYPANWSQSGRDKVKAYLENALQNPFSVSDKVALFILSDYTGDTVALTDINLTQGFEANFTLLAGLSGADYV
jgi:hypothetical protein